MVQTYTDEVVSHLALFPVCSSHVCVAAVVLIPLVSNYTPLSGYTISLCIGCGVCEPA